jgi:hypothetical protein
MMLSKVQAELVTGPSTVNFEVPKAFEELSIPTVCRNLVPIGKKLNIGSMCTNARQQQTEYQQPAM